jgi:hypothetical protein
VVTLTRIIKEAGRPGEAVALLDSHHANHGLCG